MRKKPNHASAPWTRLGGPPAGSVAALAAVQTDVLTVFAGTQVGVFRLEGRAEGETRAWERLPNAPLGVLALAASPDFASDQTLMAGTHTGIYVSRNGGETWQAAELPITHPTVITLSFSPNYRVDGVLLAGTMEDGVFFSNSRGARWQTSGFGLLDATFYCLGFSPNFNQDATVFSGTDTTVYHSTNGAAAWRQLNFPEEAAPALSLAISPSFAADQMVFIGTESQGLYRSADRGRTWGKLSLPAECINALLFTGGQPRLLAATESGIFASADWGETWSRLLDQPNVISLAAAGDLTVAGVVDQGVVLVSAAPGWTSIPSLSARSVLGLVLSPQYAEQPVAFMYGPQEGLWRSSDAGQHWESLNAGLPSADISALALAPDFATSQVAVAATPTGLLVSRDGGQHWQAASTEGATLAAFSLDGRRLIASFASGVIQATDDLGANWQPIPGPWETGGRVVALALDDAHDLYVAVLEGLGRTLSLWHGQPGNFEKALSREVAENPVVSLFLPAGATPDRAWYAACGNTVWKLSARRGRQPAQSIVFSNDSGGASLVSLTGTQNETGQVLLAGTGQHIFKLVEDKAWKPVHDFGTERALGLVLSPHYASDKTVYGLLLGGSFCQGVIR